MRVASDITWGHDLTANDMILWFLRFVLFPPIFSSTMFLEMQGYFVEGPGSTSLHFD